MLFRSTVRQMTGEHVGKLHELFTDAAVIHDGTSHNEKRDGEQRKGLRRAHKALQKQSGRRAGIDKAEIKHQV